MVSTIFLKIVMKLNFMEKKTSNKKLSWAFSLNVIFTDATMICEKQIVWTGIECKNSFTKKPSCIKFV